ncbi:MAG: hypothetical protein V2I54_03605 [Bacteroidales bacterium]|jgi:hypothetical protein|nr:hypothetical protein [Bacteroidales bacterium]
MKRILTVFVLFFVLHQAYCQEEKDQVYLKNKNLIEGSIIQITKTRIEINPTGDKPFLTIPLEEVEVVIYKDNSIYYPSKKDIPEKKSISRTIKGKHIVKAEIYNKYWTETQETAQVVLNSKDYNIELDFSVKYFLTLSLLGENLLKLRNLYLEVKVEDRYGEVYRKTIPFDKLVFIKFSHTQDTVNVLQHELKLDNSTLYISMDFIYTGEFIFEFKIK